MNGYWKSSAGRILTASGGMALTGGGLATFVGHSTGLVIMCISLLLSVLLGVFGVGLSTEKADRQGVWAVVLLPIAFFLYVLSVVVAVEMHWTGLGFVYLSAGALILARALFVKPETGRKLVAAHAH